MQFEWDKAKSEATLAERGFDFAYAALVFDDPLRIEREDVRRDYGGLHLPRSCNADYFGPSCT
jgi:uncharacterized protein